MLLADGVQLILQTVRLGGILLLVLDDVGGEEHDVLVERELVHVV